MKPVPRSNENVTMATRQPSFSAPTRLTIGTRASSKNTSANSLEPTMVLISRISTPGLSIGNITQVMPLCFGASGSVRMSSSHQSATCANEVQIFWPVMTYSSPSRTPLHESEARSEPAPGSEKPWHHTSSPLRILGRWSAFCSALASAMIVGPACIMPTKLTPM